MNYHLLRIVQVAVVIAIVGCYCSNYGAHASVELACSDPGLTDVVRRISKTRFETRDIKVKLVQCQTFVQLIREQLQLAGPPPGQLASVEPKGLLDEIAKILVFRATCPGQLIGTLSSLQEFTEDCRRLVGLASGLPTCPGGVQVVVSQETPSVKSDQSDGETRRLRDSLAEQLEAVKKMTDENGKLSLRLRELEQLQESSSGREDKRLAQELQGKNDEQQELLAHQMRTNQELEGHKTALALKLNDLMSHEAGCEAKIRTLEDANAQLYSEMFDLLDQSKRPEFKVQVPPSGSYMELELNRDANGQLGLSWVFSHSGDVYVNKVLANSPAAHAGLKFGDQLVKLNGKMMAHLKSLSESMDGLDRLQFLVRKSPMEQTYVIKQLPDEQGPGFFCSRPNLEIYYLAEGRAAARVGMRTNYSWIAMNGESVVGLDPAVTKPAAWWPKGQYTVTVMTTNFFNQLTEGMSQGDLDTIRIEHNKILAGERAARA